MIAEILTKEKAQLCINHDRTQRDSLKMAPGSYENKGIGGCLENVQNHCSSPATAGV